MPCSTYALNMVVGPAKRGGQGNIFCPTGQKQKFWGKSYKHTHRLQQGKSYGISLVIRRHRIALAHPFWCVPRPKRVEARQPFPCSGLKRYLRGKSYYELSKQYHGKSIGMSPVIRRYQIALTQSFWGVPQPKRVGQGNPFPALDGNGAFGENLTAG
jgi:hypothetical protein